MLPPPCEPLQLRFGEQNLHIPAAGFRPPRRSAALSLCSPLPANPCSSVSGSKIFTFPPPDFDLSAARRRPLFAPLYPLTLAAPFRGAKSSHFRRRISTSQALGGSFSLLPAPRKPLQLCFGEQNLHIPAAGFRPLCRPAAASLCSPLPANPCSSVPGSKIFTFPPSDFDLPGARRRPLFAPRSQLTLVAPFRGAKFSHSRRRITSSQALGGALSLLPTPREPLQLRFGEQNLHTLAAGFRPPGRPAAPALCSPLPANPCSSVSGSKIFTFPPPDFALSVARWLYASKGATANPRKTKVNPLRLYFFCTSLKNGHFSPQNGRFGLFPCCMKFAKKLYSAILSIRKDALGTLHTCAEHARLFRQALLSSNFVFYENV